LSELASVDAEILRSAQVDIFGKVAAREAIPCRIVKRSPGGAAGAEFVVEREKLVALWEILLGATHKHGGGPMGYNGVERSAAGSKAFPWFGYDFGEKQIPHERDCRTAISATRRVAIPAKEIVERVRSRGQVNRQRVGLIFLR